MTHDYDDIINLPHYEPKHHPRMSMWNRAAQFAPFAALTGYEDAIKDTAQTYLPTQKCEKIIPSTSLGVICPPVISARVSNVWRRSSLRRSPLICC